MRHRRERRFIGEAQRTIVAIEPVNEGLDSLPCIDGRRTRRAQPLPFGLARQREDLWEFFGEECEIAHAV